METLIVFLIVAGAIAYAAWRLLPASFKQGLARRLGASEAQAQQLGNSGACGSCSSCKGCATPAEKSGQPLPQRK
jgi:cytochrome c553